MESFVDEKKYLENYSICDSIGDQCNFRSIWGYVNDMHCFEWVLFFLVDTDVDIPLGRVVQAIEK